MHYKNGREAKENDPVVGESYTGSGIYKAGVIHSINPGTTACNAQLAVPIPGGVTQLCITVGECYHAEDVFVAVDKATGAGKDPASPNK
jgi:hypothetical protein